MKKEYGIIGVILLLVLGLLWFYFFRSSEENNVRLDDPASLSTNTNLNDNTLTPDNVKDYNEILINKENRITFKVSEPLPNLENGYTISSSKENGIQVSKGSIKIKRPFDVVRLWKKEVKAGGAILMSVSTTSTNEVTLNSRSTAIALVALSLNDAVTRSNEDVIRKIENDPLLTDLVSKISNNLIANNKISPVDFNTYPELSPLVDTIKNNIYKSS